MSMFWYSRRAMRPRHERRIRAEEEFRAKLQKEGMNPKVSNRIWAFLNSAFGIWMLSTIIIGLFSWSYARWQTLRNDAEEIRKIDVEIDARLSALEHSVLRHIQPSDPTPSGPTPPPGPTGASVRTPYYPLKLLLHPPGPENATQQEFANRNLKSLLFDLKTKIPFYKEQEDLIPILTAIRGYEAAEPSNKEMNDKELNDFYDKVQKLHETRWGWAMLGRDYDKYENPRRLLPNWDYQKLGLILVGLIGLFVGGYHVVRRVRRS